MLMVRIQCSFKELKADFFYIKWTQYKSSSRLCVNPNQDGDRRGPRSRGFRPCSMMTSYSIADVVLTGPFPSCFETHYESEVKCKIFVMTISFLSYAKKTNFHMKSFALSLAFIVRFTATQKWPIIAKTIPNFNFVTRR